MAAQHPTLASPPHLALSKVELSYAGSTRVLAGADLEIARGDFVVLRGPSGAGKTSMLRLFCRLEEPRHGTVLISGEDITRIDPPGLRRRVAYVQQTPTVIRGDVRENMLLPFTFRANRTEAGHMPRLDDAELRARLAVLSLEVPLTQEAGSLSVGQRQRLCLARTLLLGPEALLLDEPTSALDAESAAAVLAAAEKACVEDGVTVLLVSHGDFTPQRVVPRTLNLAQGRLAWT